MAHSAGTDNKSAPATKNTPSPTSTAAAVKAASPTTSVRSDIAETSTGHTTNYQPTPSIGGNSTGGGGGGGLSAAGLNVHNGAAPGQIEDYTPQGRSDPVDATSKPSWLQFQDFLDTMTPVSTSTGPKTFQLQQYADNANIPYLATGPGYGPPQDTKQSRSPRLVAESPVTWPLQAPPVVPAYMATTRDLSPTGQASAPLAAIDSALSDVPLPRRDPRGYADLFANDGQMTTPDGQMLQVGAPAMANSISAAAKPSMWDSVVDNTGKLLSHTGLGGIVSTMFPDIWNGAGDSIKNLLDNGGAQTKYPDDMATALAGLAGGGNSSSSSGEQVANAVADFVDLNHNGIDDKIEGYVPPVGVTPTGIGQFAANRDVSFPTSPPYRPGVDPEWTYFRDHLARGGVVGYADGGAVDPRVMMIADAEDALHRGDHQHGSIAKFVDTFGPKELENLHTNVRAGYRMRAGGVVPSDSKGAGQLQTVIDRLSPAKERVKPRLVASSMQWTPDQLKAGIASAAKWIAENPTHPRTPGFKTMLQEMTDDLNALTAQGYRGSKKPIEEPGDDGEDDFGGMATGGVVRGPGGPTDDAVPAVVDGQHPARLSSGEFILPVHAVEAIGGGDHDAGVAKLQALVEHLGSKA